MKISRERIHNLGLLIEAIETIEAINEAYVEVPSSDPQDMQGGEGRRLLLQCNECGNKFEQSVTGTDGVSLKSGKYPCPDCGSVKIDFRREKMRNVDMPSSDFSPTSGPKVSDGGNVKEALFVSKRR